MTDPIHILIVEDSEADSELAMHAIRKVLSSCEFKRVETRESFLAALESFHPNLIVSDYSMPGFNGMTALKLAQQHVPLTPVIIWTGSINEDTAVECLKAGANNYVLKENIKRLGPATLHALEERNLLVERRHAEDALRKSEERYRLLFENAVEGIFQSTPQGQFIAVNPAFARMLGYSSPQDMVSTVTDISKQVYVEEKSRAELLQLMAKQGSTSGAEFQIKCKDGDLIWVLVSSREVHDSEGNILYYEGTVEDITQRKQAEEKLRESEERFRSLYDNATIGLYRTTPDGRILMLNPAGVRMLGYDTFEEIAQRDLEKEGFEPDYPRREFRERLERDGAVVGLESAWNKKDGTAIYVRESAKAIRDENGNVIYYDGTYEDITESKRAEEAIEILARFPLEDPNPVLRVLLDGKVTYANDASGELLALWNTRVGEYLPEDWQKFVVECIKTETRKTIDISCREKVYSVMFVPILEFGYVNLYGRDVTRTKQVQDDLRESEERYRAIEQSANDGIITTDRDGNIVSWNRGAEQIFQFAESEVVGQPLTMLIPERYRAQQTAGFARVNASGELGVIGHAIETTGLRKDGTEVPIEISLATWEAKQGRFHTGIVREITERKKAEMELKEAHDLLEQRVKERTAEVQDLYDNAPAGYHSLDGEGNFQLVNQTELDWLGYTREEMLRMNIRQILTPEGQDVFSETFQRFKASGHISDVEFGFTRKDGTSFPVLVNATAIYDADGKYVMSRSTVFDITERKQVEYKLRTANTALEKAARLKNEFLASMSHELRTPLNAVIGLSESLNEGTYGELTSHQMEILGSIRESGSHLLGLINDILDLSKIEAGKLELQPVLINLENIWESSLRMIKQQVVEKHLRVSSPSVHLERPFYADERRLKQMLVNLLSNAAKFTPEDGQIGLEISLEDDDAIRFTVWDTGIGIPADKIDVLFKPFVQLDSALSRQYSGTGLGLALVRDLAELHGGSVGVESKLGKGSRFYFIIPITQKGIDSGTSEISSEAPPQKILKRASATILLAEDNAINSMVTSDYLADKGYKVVTATNGFEAIEQAETHKPDLILMDIQMPEFDGLEAIKRLRAMPEFVSVPIIALTALAMPGDRERCLEAGANDYIAKPVSLKALAERIGQLLM